MRYYDPEYDRIVSEDDVKKQFDWFNKQKWFNKSYEQYKNDNFRELRNYIVFSDAGNFVYDTDNFDDAKYCAESYGGKVETLHGDVLVVFE